MLSIEHAIVERVGRCARCYEMQKSDAGSIISSSYGLHWTSETAIEQRSECCQTDALIVAIEQSNSNVDASRPMLAGERGDIDERLWTAIWVARLAGLPRFKGRKLAFSAGQC
jgi:hypothetical protein